MYTHAYIHIDELKIFCPQFALTLDKKGKLKKKAKCKSSKYPSKAEKTLGKRKDIPQSGTTRAEFKEENARKKILLKIHEEIHVLGRIQSFRKKQAALKIFKLMKSVKRPIITTALCNWESAQDMIPYYKVHENKIYGSVADGHAKGGEDLVTKIKDVLDSENSIEENGPEKFVDDMKHRFEKHKGGAMLTAFTITRNREDYVVNVASRGDSPLWTITPTGDIRQKTDHIPKKSDFLNDDYYCTDARNTKWQVIPTKDNTMTIALSFRGEKAIYANCKKSGKQLASFATIGDSVGEATCFPNVKTNVEEWIVPSGSVLIACSDGVTDIIDPKDVFFKKIGLTAEEVMQEAKERWQSREINSVNLDNWREGLNHPILHKYPAGTLGKDDISVIVIHLP